MTTMAGTEGGEPAESLTAANRQHRGVDLRHTHPSLYQSMMILATASVLLAINFWATTPTFKPYGWNDDWVGAVFFVIGATQIVFLHVWRNLRVIRASQSVSIAWYIIWAGANTQQFFNGKASLQLPICLVTLAVVRIPWVIESPINPMTERK